jgi:hypothetical protein
MQKYRLHRLDEAKPDREVGLVKAIAFLAKQKTGGPYVIVGDGQPGPQRNKSASLLKLRKRARNCDAHEFVEWHPDTGSQWRLKKLVPTTEVIETAGTDAIDAIWTAVYHRFNDQFGIVNLGIYANKPGEHSVSNAVDIGVSKPQSADDIHQAIIDIANFIRGAMLADMDDVATGLPVNGTIVMEQICDRGGTSWRYYSGTPHVSHVHTSGWPNPLPGWI